MFHVRDDKYRFDLSLMAKAHSWCSHMVHAALLHEIDIVVTGTFTRKWEIEIYSELACRHNYDFRVIQTTGKYGNIHDVPEDTLVAMADRWEPYPGEVII